jgi:hypothetical protein
MARGDLYSEHPEWFRETISKTAVPYERQPQWKSLDARRFVEEGIEGQNMDSPEPSWKDEPDSDYRRHPAGRFVGSTVAGGNPKHWEPDWDPDTRTKGSKDEFHAGHV